MVGGVGLGLDLAEELGRLAPFGMGNPGVRLMVPSARVSDVRTMGEGKHARFSLHSGAHRALGVAFGRSSLGVGEEDPVDAAVRLEVNHWNGSVEPRVVLRELYPLAEAEDPAPALHPCALRGRRVVAALRGRAAPRPRRRRRWAALCPHRPRKAAHRRAHAGPRHRLGHRGDRGAGLQRRRGARGLRRRLAPGRAGRRRQRPRPLQRRRREDRLLPLRRRGAGGRPRARRGRPRPDRLRRARAGRTAGGALRARRPRRSAALRRGRERAVRPWEAAASATGRGPRSRLPAPGLDRGRAARSRSPRSTSGSPRGPRSPRSSAGCARRGRRAVRPCARRWRATEITLALPRRRRAVCGSSPSSGSCAASPGAARERSGSYPQRGPIWSARPRSAPTEQSTRRHSNTSKDANSRRAQRAPRRPLRRGRGVRLLAERERGRRRRRGGGGDDRPCRGRARLRLRLRAPRRPAAPAPATSSSPTRSGWPRSAPGCGSTPRPSAPPCSTTRSRTPAPASRRSARSSARRSPSWSTASPS